VLLPGQSFVSAGFFGPELQYFSGLEVDGRGNIWLCSATDRPVRVFRPDGTEMPFSPLLSGLDHQGAAVGIRSVAALAFMPPDVMCLAGAQDPALIFRFNIYTGQALPGIATDFTLAEMDCSGDGHIYALESGAPLWHVLTSGGAELEGSPFPAPVSANDIAVLSRGGTVFLSDRSHNDVQCWHGGVQGLAAAYSRGENIPAVDVGTGRLSVDGADELYVAHSPRGVISIFDRSGNAVQYLSGGSPALVAPVEIATTVSGDTLYVVEDVGLGPVRSSAWVRKKDAAGN